MISLSRIFSWSLLLTYSFFLLLGAVIPPVQIPVVFLAINDKVIHAIEFFLLFNLAFWAFRKAGMPKLYFGAVLFAFYYSLLLAFITEALQLMTPERSADVMDLAADAAGIVFAFILVQGLVKRSNVLR